MCARADTGQLLQRWCRRRALLLLRWLPDVWAGAQVTVGLRARLPAPDGSAGRTYFEAPPEQPLQFTMGAPPPHAASSPPLH